MSPRRLKDYSAGIAWRPVPRSPQEERRHPGGVGSPDAPPPGPNPYALTRTVPAPRLFTP